MKNPLKAYLNEYSVSDLGSDAPLLADRYAYERIDDIIYYYWVDKYNGQYDCECDLDVPPSIIYKSSIEYAEGNRAPIGGEIELLSDEELAKLGKAEETGYVIPVFPHLNYHYARPELYERKDSYETMIEQFELADKKASIPEKINQLHSYKEALLAQVKRQVEVLKHFHYEIASILKVYCKELERSGLGRKELGSQYFDIELLVFLGIKSGKFRKSIPLQEIAIETENETLKHVEQTSLKAIDTLLKRRDAYLKVAVELSKKLQTINYIFEKLILGKSISTTKEFLYDLAPDPFSVAKEMYAKAKNHKYSVKTTGTAMSVVRDYIIDNDLEDLWGERGKIVDLILKKDIEGIESLIDKKTIRNWIETYADASSIPYSNPNLV